MTRRNQGALGRLLAGAALAFCASSVKANDVIFSAAELGVTPESLAANDLTEHTEQILARIEAAVQLRELLATKRQDLSAASANQVALKTALSLDPQDEQLAAAHEAAAATVQSLTSDVANARQSLFVAATQDLTSGQAQKLAIWRDNSAHSVPEEFKVKQRSSAEWRAIQRALIAERRAQRLGLDVPSQHAQLLQAVRGELEVLEAVQNLQQNLGAAMQVFDQQASES